MAFRFRRLEIPDVILIEPQPFADLRGAFMESYKWSDFKAHGITDTFVQDNYSHSVRGVLRGLHYQKPPQTQAKLVGVIRGEVFDVAVDVRWGSPTYGRWISVVLSGENHHMVYVPVGFAHGFCVVSETADILYKVTAEYAGELNAGIRWDDPHLGIPWPVAHPILSPKDARLPFLADAGRHFGGADPT